MLIRRCLDLFRRTYAGGARLYLVVAACIVGVPLAIGLRFYFHAVLLLCGGLTILFWELRERGKLS